MNHALKPANLPLHAERLAAVKRLTWAERRSLKLMITREGGVPVIAREAGVRPKTIHGDLAKARERLMFGETISMLVWLVVSGVDYSSWEVSRDRV